MSATARQTPTGRGARETPGRLERRRSGCRPRLPKAAGHECNSRRAIRDLQPHRGKAAHRARPGGRPARPRPRALSGRARRDDREDRDPRDQTRERTCSCSFFLCITTICGARMRLQQAAGGTREQCEARVILPARESHRRAKRPYRTCSADARFAERISNAERWVRITEAPKIFPPVTNPIRPGTDRTRCDEDRSGGRAVDPAKDDSRPDHNLLPC